MISHPEVVWLHRFLSKESNQHALLVMGANRETSSQSQHPASNVHHIITGQQIEALLMSHQAAIARREKPPTLDQLMRRTGLRPHKPSWMRIAVDWFLTDRPSMTVDIQGISRLPPIVDAGITASALARMSFDLAPDIPVRELVQWLIEANLGVRIPWQRRQEIDAFQRVDPPTGAKGAYFAIHPFAYTLGISIAWNHLQTA